MAEADLEAPPDHVSRKAAGRKPTRKSVETRQHILAVAAVVFAEKGYALAKLSDIAERAGMHLTGLYYYYDGKEHLVSDIITQVPARALDALKTTLEKLPKSASNRQRIEAAIEVYLNAILADDDFVRADHRVASQISPEMRRPALEISRQINAIWEQLLDRAIEDGEVRADIDRTMLRMLMIGSMNWAVEWFQPHKSPPDRLADAMARLFFDGAEAKSSY